MAAKKPSKTKPVKGWDKHQRPFVHGKYDDESVISQSTRDECAPGTYEYRFDGKAKRKACLLRDTAGVRAKLETLGTEMATKAPSSVSSAIPAGYTYLGQFIDHDITLDALSDLHGQNDPATTTNFRTPRLDLDSVYGQGPGIDPFLYEQASGGKRLLLGTNTPVGPGGPPTVTTPTDFDLPRNGEAGQHTALIGDMRNDENLIVSQLHHGFLKFHNAVLAAVGDDFERARRSVTHHYQWIVMHDFLPRICDPVVANGWTARIEKRKKPLQRSFRMPVEFSVAAYRFGHSMVRENYDVNQNFPNATMGEVFAFASPPQLPVFSNWVVDFNRFFGPSATNLASAIDTRLALQLDHLPGMPPGILEKLAARNLLRGLSFDLPSGQCVADSLKIARLSRAELLQGATANEAAVLQADSDELLKKTPLWYYVLKESEVRASGQHLGKVGSKLVAAALATMLAVDENSYLYASPKFTPTHATDMISLFGFAGVT
ncbi:MAG: peroxidase family protein [Acidimicrobiales bacterium]